MKRATGEIAARGGAACGRGAAALVLAGTLMALSGCAGGGVGQVRVAEAPVPATADSVTAVELTPTPASSAAAVTRWSAEAWANGRHEEASDLLARWLAARGGAAAPRQPDQDESAVRAALAVHLEALGRADEASATLAPCAAGDAAVARARTWLNLRGDGFAGALADAELAVSQAPTSAADRNNLGIALLYAGRPVEAREAFLSARDLDPRLPGALYNLAIVESVYFFDDAAAGRWLDAYRRLSDEDPDGIFGTLGGTDVATRADSAGAGVLP